MASEINSGEYFEKRIKMIVLGSRNRKTSRWFQACALLLAVAILPLGLAVAGEDVRAETELRKTMDNQSERDAGIEGQYNKIGVSSENFERLQTALYDNGIKREQIDGVMGGMGRIIRGMQSEGENFEVLHF